MEPTWVAQNVVPHQCISNVIFFVLCQDRIPQIIDLVSHLEFNLGSQPTVTCVATGNPLPVRDNIELRKAVGRVITVRYYSCSILLLVNYTVFSIMSFQPHLFFSLLGRRVNKGQTQSLGKLLLHGTVPQIHQLAWPLEAAVKTKQKKQRVTFPSYVPTIC